MQSWGQEGKPQVNARQWECTVLPLIPVWFKRIHRGAVVNTAGTWTFRIERMRGWCCTQGSYNDQQGPLFLQSPHTNSHSTSPPPVLYIWLPHSTCLYEILFFSLHSTSPLCLIQFTAPSLQCKAGPFQMDGQDPAVLWEVLWSHEFSQGDQRLWGLTEVQIWSSLLSQPFPCFHQNF